MKPKILAPLAAAGLSVVASVSVQAVDAASALPAPAPTTIVLVHGAFADGSAWSRVIPQLQRNGFRVVAVQNTLTSQEADLATTRRVIESQPGPAIAVGHSYGGAVITGAAAGNTNVKALVYVAAFAPEGGEILGQLYDKFGPADLGPALVSDSGGFLSIDPAKLHAVFAHDVTAEEAAVMGATQKPIHGSAFAASVAHAAWKDIPSYYLLATGDRAIKPELQRYMAERIGAQTLEIDASHVPFLSQPEAVAEFIIKAARTASPVAQH
jgi:pimeloyl-ACP methyl ester carboxylesterase